MDNKNRSVCRSIKAVELILWCIGYQFQPSIIEERSNWGRDFPHPVGNAAKTCFLFGFNITAVMSTLKNEYVCKAHGDQYLLIVP